MTKTANYNPWVQSFTYNPEARLRLFCFSHAGGKALDFHLWSDKLQKTVELFPVELPGHGRRLKEPLFTRLEPLLKAIAQGLLSHLDKPFALFGHSMGALVSFELARLLRKEYGLEPAHLFVSGRRAPQISNPSPPMHTLPKSAFVEELSRFNGIPQVVLENTELMQLFLPILQADFAINETYVYTPETQLKCPITVLGGLQDKVAKFDELAAWQEQTIASYQLQMFPGDHFFLHSAPTLFLNFLKDVLANTF